jgi:uncharacterized membrane protein YfcA
VEDPFLLAVASLGVFLGALLQRLTGMGFATIVAPLMVIILGPGAGVQWTNTAALASNFIILVSTWRMIDPRRTAFITISALVATPIGVAVVASVPGPTLQIVMSLLMILALVSAAPLRRLSMIGRPGGALLVGALSGAANSSVGLAGPLLGAYAVAVRWELNSYVASMQLCWVLVNAAVVGFRGFPTMPVQAWMAVLMALVGGSLLGFTVAKRVSRRTGELVLIVVACLGSLLVLGRGLSSL